MRELWPIMAVLWTLACEASPPQATPSAPASHAPPVAPDACATGGGTLDGASFASFFPRRVSGLCIDPHADVRSYGKGEKAPLGSACEVLPGDCASYGRYGLTRVLVVPYLGAHNSRARVTVTLLELSSPEASYSLFTERILGEAPEDFRAWRAIDGEGTKMLCGNEGLVWRANHLAMVDYTDETSTPSQAAERGAPLLEALLGELARLLPGKPERPTAVALLPQRDAGPLAVRFEHEDALGIGGLGSGAVARYARAGETSRSRFSRGRTTTQPKTFCGHCGASPAHARRAAGPTSRWRSRFSRPTGLLEWSGSSAESATWFSVSAASPRGSIVQAVPVSVTARLCGSKRCSTSSAEPRGFRMRYCEAAGRRRFGRTRSWISAFQNTTECCVLRCAIFSNAR